MQENEVLFTFWEEYLLTGEDNEEEERKKTKREFIDDIMSFAI